MRKKSINHMHWIIKVTDYLGAEVGGGYFDGTAQQCTDHIKAQYRANRSIPNSGSQVYFPATQYEINAKPNGLHFPRVN